MWTHLHEKKRLWAPYTFHDLLEHTFQWQARVEVLQNILRRLLVSKQAFKWEQCRPMPIIRSCNEMVLFSCLGSSSYWNVNLNQSKKAILMVCLYLRVSRAIKDTTVNQVWFVNHFYVSYNKSSADYGCRQDLHERSFLWSCCPTCKNIASNSSRKLALFASRKFKGNCYNNWKKS